jgi:hypothetical protein
VSKDAGKLGKMPANEKAIWNVVLKHATRRRGGLEQIPLLLVTRRF